MLYLVGEMCPARERSLHARAQAPALRHAKTGESPRLNLAARLVREENITESQERTWLTEYQTHSEPRRRHKALEYLWMAYGKLVVSMAARYRQTPQMFDDLLGAGFLGLLDAINDFDLRRKGVRLGTYAGFRIRHEMQTFLRSTSQPVCLPDSTPHRQLVRHSRRLFEDAERACRREGTTPNQTELCRRVAARVGLPVFEVESTVQLLGGHHVSLDNDPDYSHSSPSLSATSHEEAVVATLDSAKVKRRVLALMDEILGTSERRVFQARCMTNGEPLRREELAAELRVTSERIYQLEVSAKRKIAVALAQQGFAHVNPATLVRETSVRASRRKFDRRAAHLPEAVAAQ